MRKLLAAVGVFYLSSILATFTYTFIVLYGGMQPPSPITPLVLIYGISFGVAVTYYTTRD